MTHWEKKPVGVAHFQTTKWVGEEKAETPQPAAVKKVQQPSLPAAAPSRTLRSRAVAEFTADQQPDTQSVDPVKISKNDPALLAVLKLISN
jgi:hypothetical protein